ncbi:Short-chain dehydrogenase/reductase SDR [Pleurostoma richardsiae]|uniref:Short-chain dehydrogenase/reductase SDR n=1 Tax=Pleurostoma richardsiae TaxID=41990 RepID=A0AA38RJN4_9PEZI|nr:Short-chain dehydrogenase/reductase SDR [Pleurostoma richardsiae]
MSASTTYLITGANRGIGKGFVTALLQRPSTTVIAAVRDPLKESSRELNELPKAADSKIIIVKLDSTVESDPANAVAQLQKHGIASLDVVIANAGIGGNGGPVAETSAHAAAEHFAVNAIGPMKLFQATAGLLKASKGGNPIFVAISTLIGSIGGMEALAGFPNTTSPYGASKAALNWIVRRLHFEEPWLTSFVFHPGLVETDMAAAATAGTDINIKDLGAISVETSVASMLKTVYGASRAISGTFQNYDGTVLPW